MGNRFVTISIEIKREKEGSTCLREREKERVNIGRRKVEIGCEDLFNEFVRVST